MTTFNTVSRRFATKTMTLAGPASRLAALLVLSIGTLGGAAAHADQPTRSAKVTLADLDLSTIEGQQIAQQRLQEIARTLCTRVTDELDLSHHENYVRCVDAAGAKAGEQLHALLNRQPTSRMARADVQ